MFVHPCSWVTELYSFTLSAFICVFHIITNTVTWDPFPSLVLQEAVRFAKWLSTNSLKMLYMTAVPQTLMKTSSFSVSVTSYYSLKGNVIIIVFALRVNNLDSLIIWKLLMLNCWFCCFFVSAKQTPLCYGNVNYWSHSACIR